MPEPLAKQAKKKAKAQGRSFSNYVRWLIEQDIAPQPKAASK